MAYLSNDSLYTNSNLLRISVMVFLIMLQSCSNKTITTGNLPDPDLVANIEVGQVSKNEVLELLGSPSTKATFNDNDWYYVSEKISSRAFFHPETLKRKVLIIQFDKREIVKKITQLSLKDGEKIEMVDRITPTAGKEMTILKQIFGNVGRFENRNE